MDWIFFTDFILVTAQKTPKDVLPEIRRSTHPWAVLEMPMSDSDILAARRKLGSEVVVGSFDSAPSVLPTSYYYAVERGKLVYYLDRFTDEERFSLVEVLSLRKERANLVVFPDRRVFHPQPINFVQYGGQFSPAVVAVASRPYGLILRRSERSAAGEPVLAQDYYGSVPEVSPEIDVGLEPLLAFFRDRVAAGRFPDISGGETTDSESSDTTVESDPITPKSEDIVDVTMGAVFPQSLAVGETADLVLSLEVGDQVRSANETLVQLSSTGEVKAVLSHSPNLRLIQGSLSRAMKVPTPTVQSRESFVFEGVEVGPASVIVRLFQPPTRAQVGYLKLQREVTEILRPRLLAQDSAATYMPEACDEPDLVLHIDEYELGPGKFSVEFRITGGRNYPRPDLEGFLLGSKTLDISPNLYFQNRFAKIEKMPFVSVDRFKVAKTQMVDEGRLLWGELFSAEVRQELQDRGADISCIQVRTNGHHIPWEMILLPSSHRKGRDYPEAFLAERYQVTRWIERYRAPCLIRLRDLLYVAPHYEDGKELRHATEEAEFLKGLKSDYLKSQAVLPARMAEVLSAVKAGQFDIFHFVGHASQAEGIVDYSSLELEPDVEETSNMDVPRKFPQALEPKNVVGLESKWGPRRPLLFFNACQTGRQDTGLVRPGGWANAVLGSKAGAFVGTLWSVRDEAAMLFSKTFYQTLLEGKTFGESAHAARLKVAATGDPSWLAYVVYAHPNAKVIIEPATQGVAAPG